MKRLWHSVQIDRQHHGCFFPFACALIPLLPRPWVVHTHQSTTRLLRLFLAARVNTILRKDFVPQLVCLDHGVPTQAHGEELLELYRHLCNAPTCRVIQFFVDTAEGD